MSNWLYCLQMADWRVCFYTLKLCAPHCFRLRSKLSCRIGRSQVNPRNGPASSGCFGRRPFPGSQPGQPPSAGDAPAAPPLHLYPSAAIKTTVPEVNRSRGKRSRARNRKAQCFTVCVATSTPSPRSALPSEASGCRPSLSGRSAGATSGAGDVRAPS